MDTKHRNDQYWTKRSEMKEQAKRHVRAVEEYYLPAELDLLAQHGTIYERTEPEKMPHVTLVKQNSVDAIFELAGRGRNTAVLNFASYKEPGGRFLDGSTAQEESLCHRSDLYALLSRRKDFYAYNNQHKNRGLYENRALYFRNVVFYPEPVDPEGKLNMTGTVRCDVITCAAPNKRAAQEYCHVTLTENAHALTDRCRFVLEIAENNEVEYLILGAYGCGVFGQNPIEVAGIFCRFLREKRWRFKEVRFAIPIMKPGDANWYAFINVFRNEYPAEALEIRS